MDATGKVDKPLHINLDALGVAALQLGPESGRINVLSKGKIDLRPRLAFVTKVFCHLP
jgi:hypothetical protein